MTIIGFCFVFRHLVSGFGYRVSGFGYRVSGIGFRVSGIGFRVSGFGYRASPDERGDVEDALEPAPHHRPHLPPPQFTYTHIYLTR